MSKYSSQGWHFQHTRHSNARKYGKAGGTYAKRYVLIGNSQGQTRILGSFKKRIDAETKEGLLGFEPTDEKVEYKIKEYTPKRKAGWYDIGHALHYGKAKDIDVFWYLEEAVIDKDEDDFDWFYSGYSKKEQEKIHKAMDKYVEKEGWQPTIEELGWDINRSPELIKEYTNELKNRIINGIMINEKVDKKTATKSVELFLKEIKSKKHYGKSKEQKEIEIETKISFDAGNIKGTETYGDYFNDITEPKAKKVSKESALERFRKQYPDAKIKFITQTREI